MSKKLKDSLYDDDLDLFPDYDTFLNNLKTLDTYNFSNLSNREIYDIFYDHATILPTNFRLYNSNSFNGHTFYRVRLNVNTNKEDISLSQTFSYPPSFILSENGRANLKMKSVFYCSNNPRGAILESKPKVNEEGFLSFWKGIAIRPIKLGICLPYELPENNEWNIIANDVYKLHMEKLPEEAKNKFQHFVTLYEFIAHKFIDEKRPYPLTSMISNELLYGSKLWHDLILYPSVLAQAQLCNMAFHPNSVDENLKFEKVIRFKVVIRNKNQIGFKLGKVGYINENKMKWRDKTKDEILFFNEYFNEQ